MTTELRDLEASDWPSVSRIYTEGIAAGDATFETVVPDWGEWHESRSEHPRLVALRGGTVVGFAALSPVSQRATYAGVREVMVYVAAGARGTGVGGSLMRGLVEAAEAAGIWTLQASIFPENLPSIRAHERVGFRIVGTRERIGSFHDGRWRDTVLMERRSLTVG